ncbi:MAG: DUF4293 domain-containing protein [Muribaculaceae bacterium]|nr:DUF4293 domain-containing protein [Muribaculaceae bacterium]
MFLASIMMISANFMPWCTLPETESYVTPVNIPVMLIINILVALLLIVDIFMYRNTSRQKTIARISAALIAVSAIVGLLMLSEASIAVAGAILPMLLSEICIIIALRRISSDENLLRNADRLR